MTTVDIPASTLAIVSTFVVAFWIAYLLVRSGRNRAAIEILRHEVYKLESRCATYATRLEFLEGDRPILRKLERESQGRRNARDASRFPAPVQQTVEMGHMSFKAPDNLVVVDRAGNEMRRATDYVAVDEPITFDQSTVVQPGDLYGSGGGSAGSWGDSSDTGSSSGGSDSGGCCGDGGGVGD